MLLHTLVTALLLFVGGAAQEKSEPSLEKIVASRLLTSFKEGCDKQATTIRNLGIAVKAAYGDLRRREGENHESSEMLLMQVKETAGEDNSSYSRKVMSFSVRSLQGAEEERLFGGSSRPSDDETKCLVSKLHLKKVGVSVVSLENCPLIAADLDVAVSAFQNDDCVSFVERDSIVHLYPTFEGPSPDTPEDPASPAESFGAAYWLELTGVDRLWATNKCLKEVVVGVIDTGVAVTHPDLKDNIWRNEYEIPGNGIDDDRNGYIDDIFGFDFYQKTAQVSDGHGHGTHVAGIIGATPNTTKVQGVCKNVSIAALRFMDSQGAGATSDAIEAVNYSIEMDFHMTSNSWGGPEVSAALLQSIQRAAAIDQLFVAAAGNSGNNADQRPEYPAAYKVSNIISVAATDEADRLANFSNYGNSVHIAAPGVFILSTFPPAGSKSLSGTSMAAPVISGIAAMILSARLMPVRELKSLLLNTADRPRTLKNRISSSGRVSAGLAMCTVHSSSHKGNNSLARRLRKRIPPNMKKN